MKNIKKIFATVAMAALVAATMAGCDKDDDKPTYTVTLTDDGHGTASASANNKGFVKVAPNTEITLRGTPDEGYFFAMWTVVGGDVELSNQAANVATFTMPAGDVAIKAVFRLPYEPDMVWVAPGTFTMGSDDSAADPDEHPAHEVTLTRGYFIGKYEVTQAQWYAVMDKSADESPARFTAGNLPIENVRYAEAQEYIAKLNAVTGKTYALPTEAQWEFAARGGVKSRGYTYSGGNTLSVLGWYGGNSGGVTHPVGTAYPNELGIYDMSGNVWEWTADWFSYYTSAAQTDPAGPAIPLPENPNRVYRGGCFDNPARHSWPSNRGTVSPDDLTGDLGLRLMLVP